MKLNRSFTVLKASSCLFGDELNARKGVLSSPEYEKEMSPLW